eukprot:TRINITY_DN4260_c0_g1_i1.p1 TRINITY_DN4260_c0_g1~~TRINITY_DN4260_c0_g1_i1.p1  ORF type:complete len:950 (+),score=252.13 TRINITY_DN4260_c0_g1_i1:112-2961(+)
MAEFARWQWDDIGTWRDFAEQFQAIMETAFQRREKSVELAIPPFGTFRMDLKNMTQVTLAGRNPGYERSIRRQARKVELGYFLRGVGGEMFASDAAVDRIDDRSVLEALVGVLRRILDEPEEFMHRSINLASDEFCATLGSNDAAQEVLQERGFELIEEGPERFLVFMQEQLDGLAEARQEAEACLERLQRKEARAAQESNEVPAESNNVVAESNEVLESNEVPESNEMPESNEAPPVELPAPAAAASAGEGGGAGAFGRLPSTVAGAAAVAARATGGNGEAAPEMMALRLHLPGAAEGSFQALKLPGTARLADLLAAICGSEGASQIRLPLLRAPPEPEPVLDSSITVAAVAAAAPAVSAAASGGKQGKKKRGKATGKGKGAQGYGRGGGSASGAGDGLDSPAETAAAASAAAAKATAEAQAEDLEQRQNLWKRRLREPLLGPALAAEPGTCLWTLCRDFLADASAEGADSKVTPLFVEDFEPIFAERLQNGVLRLRDLAAVAPLLDWERPELTKLLVGRARSLLEDPCTAWCEAAECDREEELLCGRALLRHVYGEKSLEERLQLCRDLLPHEKRDAKTRLQVDRSQGFLSSALGGLLSMRPEELRNPLSVQFRGEIAEDQGGPRRDFFALFGARLCSERDSQGLWRRLAQGALAPVPDLVAESSPKETKADLEDAEAAYRACGRACGLATKYGDVLTEEFAGFFLHQVCRDDTVGLEELQRQLSDAEGSEDIRSTGVLLRQPLAETGMAGVTLSRTITGTTREVDLVLGGRSLPVTDDNKELWLRLHLHDKLYGSLRKAAEAFRQGLLDVFGGSRRTCPLLVMVSPSELASLWAGSDVSDEAVERWRSVATISEEVREQAAWFWSLLEDAGEAFRSDILRFTTGAGRLSHAGLSTFEIQPADGGDDALPRAMTCANMLQLPRYSSRNVLDRQLRKAIEFCDGFQIL